MSTRSTIGEAVTDVISGKALKEMEKAKKEHPSRIEEDEKCSTKNDVNSKTSKDHSKDKKSHLEQDPAHDVEAPAAPPRTNLGPGPSLGSLAPPAPPCLRRSQGRLLEARPGAVAVQGTGTGTHSLRLATDDNHANSNEESILVNAHLVMPSEERDIEQASSSTMTKSAEVTVATNLPPPALVKAEPLHQKNVGNISKNQQSQPGVYDMLKSRTVQLLLLGLCIVLIGLIVGVIVGFGANNNNNNKNVRGSGNAAIQQAPTTTTTTTTTEDLSNGIVATAAPNSDDTSSSNNEEDKNDEEDKDDHSEFLNNSSNAAALVPTTAPTKKEDSNQEEDASDSDNDEEDDGEESIGD